MSSIQAPLIPFERLSASRNLKMEVKVEHEGSLLRVIFDLQGDLQNILFPSRMLRPARLDCLWQKTCFEAFLSWERNPFYYELNASSSGDWNFYRFDHYRTGQVMESSVSGVHVEMSPLVAGQSRVTVMTDLVGVLPKGRRVKLELGVAAVIAWDQGQKEYWAVKHAGKKPDFHLRESFILKV